jgi:hypothetical protein
VRNKQEEDLISTLYAQVNQLKSKNANLTKQNEKLTEQLERKKREVSILTKGQAASKRPQSAGKTTGATRKTSPQRAISESQGSLTKPLTGNPLPSAEIEIRATSARKSHDRQLRPLGDIVNVVDSNAIAAVAAQDENLLKIAQNLKAR